MAALKLEKRNREDKKLSINLWLIIFTGISFLSIIGVISYKGIILDMECTGHLERAANSTNIELASGELDAAISYLDKKGLTSGYTSIFWKTPNEDIGFWYNNIKEANRELKNAPDTISNLEESNMLIKLRETLITNSKDGEESIICPNGLSRYPNNGIFALLGNLSWILLAFLIIRRIWILEFF